MPEGDMICGAAQSVMAAFDRAMISEDTFLYFLHTYWREGVRHLPPKDSQGLHLTPCAFLTVWKDEVNARAWSLS
jgi:hypothetical protein